MMKATPRVSMMETVLKLVITSYDHQGFRGRIYSKYYDRVILFTDLLGMLNAMERLYDTLSFPQSSVKYRTFEHKNKKIQTQEKRGITVDHTSCAGKATFIVHVQFRQNATWQGSIQWVDEHKEQKFRSTLEMIKLIDDALEQGGQPQISWEK